MGRLGHTLPLEVFLPAVIFPGLIFNILMAWPLIESGKTKDSNYHNLLDRPRDRPKRTAAGVAMLTLLFAVFFASSTDVMANFFQLPLMDVLWFFRFFVPLAPIVAYYLAFKICHEMRDAEHIGQRKRALVVTRTAEGEYLATASAPGRATSTRSSTPSRCRPSSTPPIRSWPPRPASGGSSASPQGGGHPPARASLPMGTTVDAYVDLDRYPVLDAGGRGGRRWWRPPACSCARPGAVELAGFLTPRGVEAMVADAEALAPRAHHSSGEGTAYLEFPDFSLPEDHPRLTWGRYAVGAVPYDLMPGTSLLRRLYEWEPLRLLVESILDRGPLYRYADPFGALNLAVMGEGEELQWHFDQTDFVVSLAIQTADHGGMFEVFPRIRTADDERYDAVAAALAGRGDGVVTLPMVPGTLLVFEGRHSLHRVSPVGPGRVRHVGLLAYDLRPGTVGSDLLREDRYGRTEPFATPPADWPPR